MSWNAQGNVIEINGVAAPHKGGWRYQVKSDNDPEQRCTLNFVNCLLSGSREIQDKSQGLRPC